MAVVAVAASWFHGIVGTAWKGADREDSICELVLFLLLRRFRISASLCRIMRVNVCQSGPPLDTASIRAAECNVHSLVLNFDKHVYQSLRRRREARLRWRTRVFIIGLIILSRRICLGDVYVGTNAHRGCVEIKCRKCRNLHLKRSRTSLEVPQTPNTPLAFGKTARKLE